MENKTEKKLLEIIKISGGDSIHYRVKSCAEINVQESFYSLYASVKYHLELFGASLEEPIHGISLEKVLDIKIPNFNSRLEAFLFLLKLCKFITEVLNKIILTKNIANESFIAIKK